MALSRSIPRFCSPGASDAEQVPCQFIEFNHFNVTREMVLIKTRNGFDRTFDAKSRLGIYFA